MEDYLQVSTLLCNAGIPLDERLHKVENFRALSSVHFIEQTGTVIVAQRYEGYYPNWKSQN